MKQLIFFRGFRVYIKYYVSNPRVNNASEKHQTFKRCDVNPFQFYSTFPQHSIQVGCQFKCLVAETKLITTSQRTVKLKLCKAYFVLQQHRVKIKLKLVCVCTCLKFAADLTKQLLVNLRAPEIRNIIQLCTAWLVYPLVSRLHSCWNEYNQLCKLIECTSTYLIWFLIQMFILLASTQLGFQQVFLQKF